MKFLRIITVWPCWALGVVLYKASNFFFLLTDTIQGDSKDGPWRPVENEE